MEVEPLKTICQPNYPRREEIRSYKKVLLERIPRGWRHFGKTVAVLAAASITGCGNIETGVTTKSPTPPPTDFVQEAGSWTRSLMHEPVFFLGCVIMTPPAYTAEDAAVGSGTNDAGSLGETIMEYEGIDGPEP